MTTVIRIGKKIFIMLNIFYLASCGSGLDGEQEMFTYTFILRNKTGTSLLITGDLNKRTELVSDGDAFICSYTASKNNSGGLCSESVEIRIPDINKGYRCYKSISQVQGLCFVEDFMVYTISEGTIFTKIDTKTYQYILTPSLIENAFDLPE
ncbi:hypothetical protein [Muricauda sp. MAR_2010_75]|jgi:hypothetical protein|uniref:hypothetical protein n=1 Tax=Allomuricauda sp. MAR_2010_75 TaxID=1250232 RepID=UPI00056C3C52|nr:hypothetical protein [Muricauda sp. MAR_2010_75]